MHFAHFLVVFPLSVAVVLLIDNAELSERWRSVARSGAILASLISVAV